MRVMETHPLDFVHVNYSLASDRSSVACYRLLWSVELPSLPIVPCGRRSLRRVCVVERCLHGLARSAATAGRRPLLKFVVSHPAITCAIPATSQPSISARKAAYGTLPDEKLVRV